MAKFECAVLEERMFRKAFMAAILYFLLAGLAPIASADGVTWTMSGLTFTDGSTATGSFVFDAATNTVSAIHVVTSAGTLFTGETYTALDPGFGPFAFDMAFVTTPSLGDYTGMTVLELEFFTGLDENTFLSLKNAGGVVVADLNELVCANAVCSTVNADLRGTVQGGTVVGVVTPKTATLLLLGFGVLGFIAAAKRGASKVKTDQVA